MAENQENKTSKSGKTKTATITDPNGSGEKLSVEINEDKHWLETASQIANVASGVANTATAVFAGISAFSGGGADDAVE
jgi:hypothetical protein